MDILHALAVGFIEALSWPSIGYIVFGVVFGLTLGIIPGLGGLTGLTLLLPLAFTLDIGQALAIMIALSAVTATSDTIPAVLLGVPGTSAAAATVVDGYPLAKRGEAARALGAAFFSSATGGLFGAFVLVAAIPILRPVVLAFGPPEVFMLAMWGLATVGMLGGNDALRGWAAAGLGVTLAMIGRDPIHATPRFAFGQPFLWDGLPLIAVALGLFALPELISLSRRGGTVAQVELKNVWAGQIQGIKDVLRNWWLLLRCSAIGTWVGFLPGVGGSVADWMAYGHAQVTARDKSQFGKGDIRGVIAPESANNSVKGGDLIPTLAFGVPGSAGMALLFGAMLIAGVSPGRQLLEDRLDLTMMMVWSLVIANIVGAGICFVAIRYLARITELPGYLVTAVVAPVIMLSTFAGEGVPHHMLILLVFGLLGIVMRQFDWPRPPLLVGFVLGNVVENNLVNSVRLFGWDLLTRPVTLVLLALLIATFAYGIIQPLRRQKQRQFEDAARDRPVSKPLERRLHLSFEIALFALMLFALIYPLASDWRFYSTLMPVIFATFGAVTTGAIVLRDVRRVRGGKLPLSFDPPDNSVNPFLDLLSTMLQFFGWLIVFYVVVLVTGFMPAMFLATLVYLRFMGNLRWLPSIAVAAGLIVLVYILYDQMLAVVWPRSLLSDLL
jgi:putative tricarboxylic transport membrane protein